MHGPQALTYVVSCMLYVCLHVCLKTLFPMLYVYQTFPPFIQLSKLGFNQ